MHIFISYRRKDIGASNLCTRIYDFLIEKYGQRSVFVDIDSVPPGVDFREVIKQELNFTDILIALVGDQWIEIIKNNKNSEIDYVRFELEYAIEKKIQIVPLLIGKNVKMPEMADLPPSISKFSYFNAFFFDTQYVNLSLEKLRQGLDLLYSRFEIKADLFGTYIRRPNISKEHEDFRNQLQERAGRKDASGEDLFAWAEYIRDVCLHISEWYQALSIYEEAAKKGFIPAMYVLGHENSKGYSDPFFEGDERLKMLNETTDFKQSAYWYRMAAEALFNQKRNL